MYARARTLGAVRRRCAVFTGFVMAAIALAAPTVHAQMSVCAALRRDEYVQRVCAPIFSVLPAVRFLDDFTVDHLFKPAPPLIERSILETSRIFATKEIDDNPALKSFLGALAPLRFSQLDRTTGTLQADFDGNQRQFEGLLAGVEARPTLTLRLPRRLDSGYWRGPDVLEIVFWERSRIAVRVDPGGGRVFEGEVECLSLSPDGLLMRFTPATTPPLLVSFGECDP